MSNGTSADYHTLCEVSRRIADSHLIHWIVLLKAVLCFVSAITSIKCVHKQKINWLGNPNTKLLFRFHMLSAVMLPFSFTLSYLFDGIRYLLPTDDPCGYVLSTKVGIAFRALPGLSFTIQSVSMMCFAIERVVSTAFPEFYDKRKTSWFATLLIGVVVSADIFFFIMRIIVPSDFNEHVILTTVWNKGNRSYIQTNVFIYLFMELATVVTFTVTLIVNKRLNKCLAKSSCDLNRKYQISENMKMLRTLQPCFYAHFVLQGIQYGALPFVNWLSPSGRIPSLVFVEVIALQPYLYCLLLPLVLYLYNKRQRRIVVDGYGSTDHIDHINQLYDNHFDATVSRATVSHTVYFNNRDKTLYLDNGRCIS